jgi:hypothetical protein
MPYIYVASLIVTAFMTIGMAMHFNASSEPQLGAASTTYQRTLLPIDSTENLGTTTRTWDELHVNEICLTADCKTVWPSAGGGGSFPFTATTNFSQVVYATNTPTLWLQGGIFASSTSQIAYASSTQLSIGPGAVGTPSLTFTADPDTGIYYNGANTVALSGGGAGVSWNGSALYPNTDDTRSLGINSTNDWYRLNALYASTTAINIGADFVSDLDGAGLTLTSGALDVNDVTAAMLNAEDFGEFTCNGTACTIDDNIIESEHFGDDDWGEGTIASNVFTIDDGVIESEHFGDDDWGEITIATNVATVDDNVIESEHLGDDDWGDITIASNAAVVEDDSHAHTATTITAANLTATDASITFSGTYNGSTARTIGVNLGHAFVWTSTHDFGGATSIEMVNGASPTVDAIGEFALDTTDNELLIATSTNAAAPAVIKPYEWKGFVHSSSTQGSGSTTKPFFIAPPNGAGYFDSITCSATSSTANLAFLRVLLFDEAGNRMNDLVASTTEGTVKFTVNNAFTAGEVISAQIGTTTSIGTFAAVTCWTKIFWTRN